MPRMINQLSKGERHAPVVFAINRNFSKSSCLEATKNPPSVSLCPPRNLVAL